MYESCKNYKPKEPLKFAASELTGRIYAIRGERREDVTEEFKRFIRPFVEELRKGREVESGKA